MIGGKTSFDFNPTAMLTILQEWQSADAYATRIAKIRNGGGLNGTNELNVSTVTDDAAADSLTGGAGLDWFWANLAEITDLNNGGTEQVN